MSVLLSKYKFMLKHFFLQISIFLLTRLVSNIFFKLNFNVLSPRNPPGLSQEEFLLWATVLLLIHLSIPIEHFSYIFMNPLNTEVLKTEFFCVTSIVLVFCKFNKYICSIYVYYIYTLLINDYKNQEE